MFNLLSWCHWLERTGPAGLLRDSTWVFPAVETLHLIGIVLLVGSTSVLDLRLLGWALPGTSISSLTRRVLPWAWVGFAIQLVTGVLLFASEATKTYPNAVFRLKMLLIVAAGVNAMVFHLTTNRQAEHWERNRTTPIAAKIAGLTSIALWFGIVIAGRFIAYFD
jgi:uncharacterized membrane protein